jgi:hypothetical protein
MGEGARQFTKTFVKTYTKKVIKILSETILNSYCYQIPMRIDLKACAIRGVCLGVCAFPFFGVP